MRSLILLRHGEAEPAGPGGDAERVLTVRGVSDAQAAGVALAKLGAAPTLALVSPAKRTMQTWKAASASFPGVEARMEKALFHTTAATILAAAEAVEAELVVVVGHNPGIAELADLLSRQDADPAASAAFAKAGFPPASAAVFSRRDGDLRLDAFLPPESSR